MTDQHSEGIEFAPDLPKVEKPDGAVVIRAAEVAREKTEWLWPGRVPRRAVTLLAGREGVGKSMLACGLAARLSWGELTGEPEVTLLATAEDSLEATVRPRLEAERADLDRVAFVKMRREGIELDLSFPDDFEELRRVVGETAARLVVIDPLMAHLHGGVDSYRDQSVRLVLAPFHHLADESGCAVLVLLHLNKATGLDAAQRIGGSVGLPAAARSVLLLDRDPDDADGEHGRQRVLAHVKCNVAPLAPSLLYGIEPMLIPATGTEPEVETARIVEIGVSEYTGRDLLAPKRASTKLEEAMEFLRDELASGPRDSADVKEVADDAGIAKKTLRDAREELSVVTSREATGHTLWSLPGTSVPSTGGHEAPLSPEGHEGQEGASPLREQGDDAGPPAAEEPRARVSERRHEGLPAPQGTKGHEGARRNGKPEQPAPDSLTEEQIAGVFARYPEFERPGWPEHERRLFAANCLATEARVTRPRSEQEEL